MLKCKKCGSTKLVGEECKLCAECCSKTFPNPHKKQSNTIIATASGGQGPL